MDKQITPQEQAKIIACIDEVGLKDLKIDINKLLTIESSDTYLHQKIQNETYTLLFYIFTAFILVVLVNSTYIAYVMGVFVVALLYFLTKVKQQRELEVALLLKKLENIHKYSMIR